MNKSGPQPDADAIADTAPDSARSNGLGEVHQRLLAQAPMGQVIRFRLYGRSMRPLLWPGWLVGVERTRLSNCTPGDIVLWNNGNQWIVHRLVRIDFGPAPATFLTWGDALQFPDASARPDQLIGRLVEVDPGWLKLSPNRGSYGATNRLVGWICVNTPWLRSPLRKCWSIATWAPRRVLAYLGDTDTARTHV